MTRTAEFYLNRAIECFNTGFTSKAGQKAAMDDLRRAYEFHTGAITKALLADRSIANWNELYWGTPDLHNWKAKHSAMFAAWPVEVAAIEAIVELRGSFKAAPINTPQRAAPSPYAVRATETMMALLARRQDQYAYAVALGEIFNGLPVSANTHLCVNEHGTRYLRTFYYLAGRFTPLNTIICAAEELERRAA